jgi:hypothetical protein
MQPSVAEMPDVPVSANPGIGTNPDKERPRPQTVSVPDKIPPTPEKRLEDLRIRAGYVTRLDALQAINRGIKNRHERIAESTYHQHESGIRRITIQAADKYAQHFGVQPAYILYGDTTKYRVRVRGVVGADGIVLKPDATTETVIAPPRETGGGISALRVSDRKLFPMYQEGDTLYYNEETLKAVISPKSVAGRKCIVRTTSAICVAYIASIEDNGRASLLLPSGKERKNVALQGAAPILWTRHPD